MRRMLRFIDDSRGPISLLLLAAVLGVAIGIAVVLWFGLL